MNTKTNQNICQERIGTLTRTTVGTRDTELNTITTTDIDLEVQKVRRVKKYKSDGKPIYE